MPHHLEPQFSTATAGQQAEKAACDGLREANRPLRTVNQDCEYEVQGPNDPSANENSEEWAWHGRPRSGASTTWV